MNKDKIAQLNDLIQLDLDAVESYFQAIQAVDLEHVKSSLQQFQSDHERHVSRLSEIVRRYGGEPPQGNHGLSGDSIQGMETIRSSMGQKGALKALHENESLTNKIYDEAMNWDIDDDEIRAIVREGREDERRHWDYIDGALQALDREELGDYEQASG